MQSLLNHIKFLTPIQTIEKLDGYGSENFKISLQDETVFLVKIYPQSELHKIEEEKRLLASIRKHCTFSLPEDIGDIEIEPLHEPCFIRILKFMEGQPLEDAHVSDNLLAQLGKAAGALVAALHKEQSYYTKANEHDWNLRDALRNKTKIPFIKDAADRKIIAHYFTQFEQEFLPDMQQLRMGIIHGDLNEANIIVRDSVFNGFIDFGDISYAPVVSELAILLTYTMMMFPETAFEKATVIIQNFQSSFPLNEKELQYLPLLIATRLCVSVCNSAEAKAQSKDTSYVLVSEQAAWTMLRKWAATNPLALLQQLLPSTVVNNTQQRILERRIRVAAPSLSLSYSQPIHMSSALFQYMFAAEGTSYLDAYNNIPHVGHCHPKVVEAAVQQMRKLNTNTRYLYDVYVDYSEKLLGLFPDSLNKALLVNSGSEASDLATRIARTVTGKKSMLVMEWGYHGNTQNGIHISSYKFDRKGGKGPSDWIVKLPLPKAFKGTKNTALEYFEEAIQIIEEQEALGHEFAALITEPISGCGGQVPLIEGYLPLLANYLKQKGILLIIDEVQTGFGRLGHYFWGFEMHGVLPDMVVLGKPIANGHPMGAVVTNDLITAAFKNGMEFFSSFGGNPVSCSIGNAVIDVLVEEQLQQNAATVGDYWIAESKKLAQQFPLLANVRGSGLFVGIECLDEKGKENTLLADQLKNGLKEHCILASTDGPLDNVLKMKPPLCLTKTNVDQFNQALYTLLKKHC